MKKIYYIPIAILLLLIVTNPSPKEFRSFLLIAQNSTAPFIAGRERNFFIFSIYYGDGTFTANDNRYIGVLGNFFYLNSDTPKDQHPVIDNTKVSDTSKIKHN